MCSENYLACLQAHSQGGASGFNTPTINVEAPSSYLQNIKDKQADQPLKKRETCYRIHMLSLLNHGGWEQFILINVCIHKIIYAML